MAYPRQPGAYPPPAPNHPRAVPALVLGIIGLVCCAIVAPIAWVLGRKAITEIDASGGQYAGRGMAQAGFILGIIGTILLILGVLFWGFAAVTGNIDFWLQTS